MENAIYHFDPYSGELLSQGVADPDPLNPGTWLIPANATTEVPPSCGPGERSVFAGGAWSVEIIPQPAPPPEPTAHELWAAYQTQAQAALTKSDIVLLRCIENGVAVPADWASYRKSLRAILGAKTGDGIQPLPSMPKYPAGT